MEFSMLPGSLQLLGNENKIAQFIFTSSILGTFET